MVQVEAALQWNLEIVDEGILLFPFLALPALKLCLVFTKCDKDHLVFMIAAKYTEVGDNLPCKGF